MVAVEAAQGQPDLSGRLLHRVAGRHQLLLARRGHGDDARVAERGMPLGEMDGMRIRINKDMSSLGCSPQGESGVVG